MIDIVASFLGLNSNSPYYEYAVSTASAITVVMVMLTAVAFYKAWRFIIKF